MARWLKRTLSERFLDKVDKDNGECWIWIGAIGTSGYGSFMLNGRNTRAHRVAYLLFCGEISKLEGSDCRGTCVIHSCDNPLCVNPDHLRLGTHVDNMRDKKKRGRVISNPRMGEHHQNSKLTNEKVRRIRALCAQGINHGRIAADIGVHRGTVGKVLRHETWSHLE